MLALGYPLRQRGEVAPLMPHLALHPGGCLVDEGELLQAEQAAQLAVPSVARGGRSGARRELAGQAQPLAGGVGLLWPGALIYFAYSCAYYLLSPEFNVLYLAYIGVVATSAYALLYLLLSMDSEAVRPRFSERTPTRLAGGFLALMALLIAGNWVAMILSDLTAGVAPSRVSLGVWPMDLGIAFPAMFWGGIWLWRKEPLGFLAGGILLVKVASVGLTLVVTSWLVTRWGVPADPMLPAYAVVGLGGFALTVAYLRGVASALPHPRDDPRVQVGSANA
jgi:hypothetical protein